MFDRLTKVIGLTRGTEEWRRRKKKNGENRKERNETKKKKNGRVRKPSTLLFCALVRLFTVDPKGGEWG